MRTIQTATSNFSKKDMINARNGYSLQDCEDATVLRIVSAAVVLGPDNASNGIDDVREVGVLITDECICYTSISQTIIDTVPELCELIDEEGSVEIRLHKRRSKGGREFLTVAVL